MNELNDPLHNYDAYRDARRYRRLLAGIRFVVRAIREGDEATNSDVYNVLISLLPVLTEALDAQKAFMVVLREDMLGSKQSLELKSVHPSTYLADAHVNWSPAFDAVIKYGTHIVQPLEIGNAPFVPGLESLSVKSAVLVSVTLFETIHIIGVCDKAERASDPFMETDEFLAADAVALQYVVELITIAGRIGEQRRRELEAINLTAGLIVSELNVTELFPLIVQSVSDIFPNAPISLMTWDESRVNLAIKESRWLSTDYIHHQRVPGDKVIPEMQRRGLTTTVIDDLHQTPLGSLELIKREQLRSVMVAPLLIGQELIGALNVYSRYIKREFTEHERKLASILANHAAIAIRNAELYRQQVRQLQHFEALYNGMRAITGEYRGHQKTVLDRITEQALRGVLGVYGPKANWCAILLCDDATRALRYESVFTTSDATGIESRVGTLHYVSEERSVNGRRGVMWRAMVDKRPKLVRDVATDPDYVNIHASTRSELAVPLVDGDTVIGVLNFESDQLSAFDEFDIPVAVGLAELAVIAVKVAEQVEQLGRINSLALMTAWGADVVHAVNPEVGAIRREAYLVLQEPRLGRRIRERLESIDDYASRISLPVLPESSLAGMTSEWQSPAAIDEVAKAVIDDRERTFTWVTFELELNCSKTRIVMHEQWLTSILTHLVNNACQAIPRHKSMRLVTIRTALTSQDIVRIEVEDTGTGIAPAIQPLLFNRPIPGLDGNTGKALLLVRFLIEHHGGRIRLSKNRLGEGACFELTIPVFTLKGRIDERATSAQGADPR